MPSPKRYRKKPVEVEAVQFEGEFPSNFLRDDEQVEFDGDTYNWIRAEGREPVFVEPGYLLVREADGTLSTWPNPALFQATYEEVGDGEGGGVRAFCERMAALHAEGSERAGDEQDQLCNAYQAVIDRIAFGPDAQLVVEIDGLERLANSELGGNPKRALLASVARLRTALSQHTTQEKGSDS